MLEDCLPRFQSSASCTVPDGYTYAQLKIVGRGEEALAYLYYTNDTREGAIAYPLHNIKPLAVSDHKVLDTSLQEHLIIIYQGRWAPCWPQVPVNIKDYYAVPAEWPQTK